MPSQYPKHNPTRSLVLVADDEPVVREIVRDMAESLGHDVLLASDAHAAVRLLRRYGRQLSAVLLDLNMPGMSPAITRTARFAAPMARVLIITGDDRSTCHAHAADDVLCKPFGLPELVTGLAGALQEAA